VPDCFALYPTQIPDATRAGIWAVLTGLPARVDSALPILPVAEAAAAAAQFKLDLLNHTVLRFAFFLLSERSTAADVTPITCVTEMNREKYRSGSAEYGNRVAIVTAQQRSDSAKKVPREGVVLEQEQKQLLAVVEAFLAERQMSEMQRTAARITGAITAAFATAVSTLKPDCYKQRKPISPTTRKFAFVPTPTMANENVQQEIRYAHSRLLALVMEALRATKRKDGADQVIDRARLTETVSPLSRTIRQFLSRSCPSIVRTWAGIAENSRKARDENSDADLLLTTGVKSILGRFRRQFDMNNAIANHDQYLQLCSLRKIESDNTHAQRIFDNATTTRLTQKYRDRMAALVSEHKSVMRQFPQVFKHLFDTGQRLVLGRMDQLTPLSEGNMDFAKRSLEESRLWYVSSAALRAERGDPPYDPNAPVESRPERPEDWLIEKKPVVVVENPVSTLKPYNGEVIVAKIEQTKREIGELRTRILVERVVQTVIRVGTISYHTRMIAKVGEDKRLAARQLWTGKRAFQEEMAELEECLHDAYKVLAHGDLEVERLKGEIGEVSKVTIKLAHWRDVHLKSADMILKEIERLSATGDVNIDKLLAALEARQSELEALNSESAVFNEELEFAVHEPMRKTDEALRAIRRVVAEKMAMRKAAAESEGKAYRKTMEEFMEFNEVLREDNDKLRAQIRELEIRNGVEPAKMSPAQTPRVRFSPKIRKPQASKSTKPKSARPLYLNV
jgi:hypothetical protein